MPPKPIFRVQDIGSGLAELLSKCTPFNMCRIYLRDSSSQAHGRVTRASSCGSLSAVYKLLSLQFERSSSLKTGEVILDNESEPRPKSRWG